MRYVTVGPVADADAEQTAQGVPKPQVLTAQGVPKPQVLTVKGVPKPQVLTVKKFLKSQGYTEHQIRHVKYVPGGLLLNGKPCRAVDLLQPGDVVQVLIEDSLYNGSTAAGATNPQIPWPVLYEDEDVLVINKPAGLVVHPAHGHYEDSLVVRLGGAPSNARGGKTDSAVSNTIRIIGRLDQDTSGVLMIAKNAIAAERLQKQRWDGRLVRTYLAWVHGVPVPTKGSIEKPIGRENLEVNRMTTELSDALPAVTHYEVVQDYGETSLVKLNIETGRTHQIRVHMASIGHPLVGDPIYGNGPELGMERTALHAYELRWEQPHSGEVCSVRAELPEEIVSGLSI